ncbi:hypothetical protein [Sporomusa termitida]|uniref:Uncharacterized protein n=1 Tax=Sporomusa termitida TaxID=2377 RepID=A0A517DXS2_9FIRM|nr:hypothetical protein [Sporomusa termitida]QDR82147.1 hypothetical protein SPTER_35680 [Sporomusa termitida]
MQEMKPGSDPTRSLPQRTPGFEFFTAIHSLFMGKAESKAEEAQQLLNPQISDENNPADSLDTGKLTKLINYIRGGAPSLLLVYTAYGLLV